MVVIKPLYGIAEAGAHWWATYFKHHIDRLRMKTSTYDPCLLISRGDGNDSGFGIVGMQTDDTIGLSDSSFAAKENREFDIAGFKAKPVEQLRHDKHFSFNGCALQLRQDGTIALRQKKQGEKLKMATTHQECIEQRARGAYIASICEPEAMSGERSIGLIAEPAIYETFGQERRG